MKEEEIYTTSLSSSDLHRSLSSLWAQKGFISCYAHGTQIQCISYGPFRIHRLDPAPQSLIFVIHFAFLIMSLLGPGIILRPRYNSSLQPKQSQVCPCNWIILLPFHNHVPHWEQYPVSRITVWGPDIMTGSQQHLSLMPKTSFHTPSTDSGCSSNEVAWNQNMKSGQEHLRQRDHNGRCSNIKGTQRVKGSAGRSQSPFSKVTSKIIISKLNHLYSWIWHYDVWNPQASRVILHYKHTFQSKHINSYIFVSVF